MIENKRLPELNVSHVLFYYVGNITVCLLVKDRELLARGIAVCSDRDQFIKKTGRAKALGRAVKAALKQINDDMVVTNPILRNSVAQLPFMFSHVVFNTSQAQLGEFAPIFKSAYKPTPVEQEAKLLSKL